MSPPRRLRSGPARARPENPDNYITDRIGSIEVECDGLPVQGLLKDLHSGYLPVCVIIVVCFSSAHAEL